MERYFFFGRFVAVVQWLGWNGSTAVLSGLFIALGSYFVSIQQRILKFSSLCGLFCPNLAWIQWNCLEFPSNSGVAIMHSFFLWVVLKTYLVKMNKSVLKCVLDNLWISCVTRFLLLAVLASHFTKASYDQPSSCWCFGGNYLLNYMVLVLGFFCSKSIYFLLVGSDCYHSWWCCILCGISSICSSVLGYGNCHFVHV